MFLILYRREITDEVSFPPATHWVGLPPGYDGTRAVALKLLNQNNLVGETHAYIPPPEASPELQAAVTAEQAIGDLPPIYAREEMEAGTLRRGARRFDVPIRHDGRRRVSDFARLMRNWPGFTAPEHLLDHVIRYLPRDYPSVRAPEPRRSVSASVSARPRYVRRTADGAQTQGRRPQTWHGRV